MIVTRSPLRISLGGGGTDIPFYFKQYGSSFISCAINKHVYVCINSIIEKKYFLRYSKNESKKNLNDIQHNLLREVLKFYKIKPGIEITSFADLPSGTGLGSSGAFLTSLIFALDMYTNKKRSKLEVAKLASKIEIDILKEPVGLQDTLISSIGGLTKFEINKNGSVSVTKNLISEKNKELFQKRLHLIDTNKKRNASLELEKSINSKQKSKKLINNLHSIKKLSEESEFILKQGNYSKFGEILTKQWKTKLERSKSNYHLKIDKFIDELNYSGAYGSKLIGAGGGGYVLALSSQNSLKKIDRVISKYKFERLQVKIDDIGVKRFEL